jgi:hypothetical protein
MMHRMNNAVSDAQNEDGFVFRGYDYTPFDEAIYSPNHLICAAGVCKPTMIALYTVKVGDDKMIFMEKMFTKMFGMDDVGFCVWCDHLVTAPRWQSVIQSLSLPCLMGLRPSRSCPSPPRCNIPEVYVQILHRHDDQLISGRRYITG